MSCLTFQIAESTKRHLIQICSSSGAMRVFLRSNGITEPAIEQVVNVYERRKDFESTVLFILENLFPLVPPTQTTQEMSTLRQVMEYYHTNYIGKTHLLVATLVLGYKVKMSNSHHFSANYPAKSLMSWLRVEKTTVASGDPLCLRRPSSPKTIAKFQSNFMNLIHTRNQILPFARLSKNAL